jgi:cytochrome c
MRTTLGSMMSATGMVAVASATLALSAVTVSAQQGGMMDQEMMDLSTLSPDQEVASLRYCDTVYQVTTGEGDTLEFPEFNLRFKSDASDMGPPQGTPALIGASMMGDRAFVIFASLAEISAFISEEC